MQISQQLIISSLIVKGCIMYSILYVDDEPVLCELAKEYLTRTGDMTVDIALSARSGLNLIQKKQYDAIISDFEMPEMNGITMLQELRDSGYLIPFILFTGRGREDVAKDALNKGADFYLQKGGGSCQFTELIHFTRRAIQNYRSQEAIQQSQKQLEIIFNHLPDPTLVIDTKGKVIAWNEAMEKLTGISSDQMVGKGDNTYAIPFYCKKQKLLLDHLISPSDEIFSLYEKVREYPSGITANTHCTINGKEHTFWIKASLIYDNSGMVTGAIETIRDTTQRTRVLHILKNAKNHFEMIVEHLPDATFAVNTHGKVIAWNKAMEKITGVTKKQVMGNSDLSYAQAIYSKQIPLLIDYLLRNIKVDFTRYDLVTWGAGTLSAHTRIKMKNNENVCSYWATTSLLKSDDGFFGAIESIREISDVYEPKQPNSDTTGSEQTREHNDVTRTESALKLAHKKIQLIHEISRHDMKNYLTSLQSALTLMDPETMNNETKEYLKMALKSTSHIHRELSFTALFHDLGSLEPSWINVRQCLLSHYDTLQESSITISCSIPENLEIFTDPLFSKVCYNLIENAVRHGKHISEIRCSAEKTSYGLTISIADNGCGISSADKQRIFSRGHGKNTGLGLFLAREILSLTGIRIEETGEEGKGAIFEMMIPEHGFRMVDGNGGNPLAVR